MTIEEKIKKYKEMYKNDGLSIKKYKDIDTFSYTEEDYKKEQELSNKKTEGLKNGSIVILEQEQKNR